jgi:DNA-binding LacI/PurR family transcriptional regulator
MAKRYYPNISSKIKSHNDSLKADDIYEILMETIRRDAVNYHGFAIVSERKLAEDLKVDRSVIHRIYEQLKKIGLLERNINGRRYFVCPVRNNRSATFPCIGIVLPMNCSEYFAISGSYHSRQMIYNGIVDRATELEFSTIPLLLPDINAAEDEIKKYLSVTLPRVDGIIHLGDRGKDVYDNCLAKMLEHWEVPQVFVSSWTEFKNIGSVQSNIGLAVNTLSHYLKEFGHKKVGLISSFMKRNKSLCHYTIEDMSGLKVYLSSAGMDVRDEWMLNGIPHGVNVREALWNWFNKLITQPEFPTVFLCKRDIIALELMQQIQKCGYDIPKDFSVIGMQNIKDSENSSPPLTTLRQPMYESGVHAVNMIFDFIQNGVENCETVKKLPMTLVERNSVGCCSHFDLSLAL